MNELEALKVTDKSGEDVELVKGTRVEVADSLWAEASISTEGTTDTLSIDLYNAAADGSISKSIVVADSLGDGMAKDKIKGNLA